MRIETEHPTMSWGELQDRLTETMDAVEHWKSEFQRAVEERNAQRAVTDAQRRTADARALRIISSIAMRQQLPHRLAIARRATRDAALVQRFAAGAPAYRDACGRGGPPASATKTTLDGLEWWTPAGWASESPLHMISQTRDVAVGGLAIEIGAGTGEASVVRVALGDARGAYCTEPHEAAYECLVANIVGWGLDGLVLPDRVAIGGAAAGGQTLDGWIRDVGIEVDAVGFVCFRGSVTAAMLDGARDLLGRRHIVWQVELHPELLGEEGVRGVAERLSTHFTHFIVISTPPPGARVRPVAQLGDVAVAAVSSNDNVALVLYCEALRPADETGL